MGNGPVNIHIRNQNNIQNLLLIFIRCAGCSMKCDSRCVRNANHYPSDTWDIPRVISSGAVSPSVMGHDDGTGPVQ